jgi:hypothetical protein
MHSAKANSPSSYHEYPKTQRTETLELSLSVKDLANIPINQSNLDCRFVARESKFVSFVCCRFSVSSARQTLSEPTTRFVNIYNGFDQFLSFGYGRPFSVSTSSLAFFRSICSEFRNREIDDELFAGDDCSLREDHVFDQLISLWSVNGAREPG